MSFRSVWHPLVAVRLVLIINVVLRASRERSIVCLRRSAMHMQQVTLTIEIVRRAMQWEYLTVQFGPGGGLMALLYHWLKSPLDGEVVTSKLNALGAEGWQLCETIRAGWGAWYFVFRRPVAHREAEAGEVLDRMETGISRPQMPASTLRT